MELLLQRPAERSLLGSALGPQPSIGPRLESLLLALEALEALEPLGIECTLGDGRLYGTARLTGRGRNR